MARRDARLDLGHFDHGTQRAILRLYRSAPSEVLEEAGERLSPVTAPTLVLWGEQDPYIPARFGAIDSRDASAERATAQLLPTPVTGRGSTGPT